MNRIIKFFLRQVPRKYLQRFVYLATNLLKVFYLGDNVKCSVCGKHYRKFLPYGYVNQRSNALCPNCLSLERHRLLWLYINNKTNLFTDNLRFLHIAPELCFINKFKNSNNLTYHTADLESPWADIHLNIEDMPLDDESYDVIMANHILEHVENLDKALKEIYRVLKKGGWAILISPINPKREHMYYDSSIKDPLEREKHFGQKDHLREFGQDYGDILRSSGLDVIEDKYIYEIPKEDLKKYALVDGEINIEQSIFICYKR